MRSSAKRNGKLSPPCTATAKCKVNWPASGWSSTSARTNSRASAWTWKTRGSVPSARRTSMPPPCLAAPKPMPKAYGLPRHSSSFADPSNRNIMNLPLAATNERLMAGEALAARLNEERTELGRRETALQQQVTSMGDETAALTRQSEELALQLEGLRGEKLRLENRQRELEQEWEAARTRLTQMEDHLRMGRQSLQEMREQRSHAEVEHAKNESDWQHLRETCMSEVNAQPEDLIASETAFMSGDELALAETNYREMKQRIESMGAVNMMALEEFNECDQRFTFLTRERDDLLQSIADTQQAIAELDLATKEKFEHAFHAINKSFSEAFHTIFGGGMAEMRLTEPDSSGEAGIDIVASPPGKRLQNVLLLSGGEKAMTALALLIAIFRYQPSPFCILDEVDAPLDEANVGRFTRLIGEMSGQTQFIIVTHNRKTMEIGSVLYGVTMQEPGVSKLVSVRWEESAPSAPSQQAAAASAA